MRTLRGYAIPLLLIAVVIGGAAWLRWPRRIDVPLDGSPAITQARAGATTVTITSTRRSGNDNGVATLQIATSTHDMAIDAAFNYDTLMDQPAGHWHYAWLDGDVWPDVMIRVNSPAPQVIGAGSADGMMREVAAP